MYNILRKELKNNLKFILIFVVIVVLIFSATITTSSCIIYYYNELAYQAQHLANDSKYIEIKINNGKDFVVNKLSEYGFIFLKGKNLTYDINLEYEEKVIVLEKYMGGIFVFEEAQQSIFIEKATAEYFNINNNVQVKLNGIVYQLNIIEFPDHIPEGCMFIISGSDIQIMHDSDIEYFCRLHIDENVINDIRSLLKLGCEFEDTYGYVSWYKSAVLFLVILSLFTIILIIVMVIAINSLFKTMIYDKRKYIAVNCALGSSLKKVRILYNIIMLLFSVLVIFFGLLLAQGLNTYCANIFKENIVVFSELNMYWYSVLPVTLVFFIACQFPVYAYFNNLKHYSIYGLIKGTYDEK